jgi:hypothetical protein
MRLWRLLTLVPLVGCHDVTAPDPNRIDLDANRAKWAAHGLTTANAVDDVITYTVSNLSEIPPPPGRFIP